MRISVRIQYILIPISISNTHHVSNTYHVSVYVSNVRLSLHIQYILSMSQSTYQSIVPVYRVKCMSISMPSTPLARMPLFTPSNHKKLTNITTVTLHHAGMRYTVPVYPNTLHAYAHGLLTLDQVILTPHIYSDVRTGTLHGRDALQHVPGRSMRDKIAYVLQHGRAQHDRRTREHVAEQMVRSVCAYVMGRVRWCGRQLSWEECMRLVGQYRGMIIGQMAKQKGVHRHADEKVDRDEKDSRDGKNDKDSRDDHTDSKADRMTRKHANEKDSKADRDGKNDKEIRRQMDDHTDIIDSASKDNTVKVIGNAIINDLMKDRQYSRTAYRLTCDRMCDVRQAFSIGGTGSTAIVDGALLYRIKRWCDERNITYTIENEE